MSKDLFLQLREEQISQLYPATFTKKEAISTGAQLASTIIENGNVSKHSALANLIRLDTVISTAIDKLKSSVSDISVTEMGVEFRPTNGRKMVQYSDDSIWVELQKALKDREILLNTSLKIEAPVFDNEGIEIPKVSVKYANDSLTIKF